KVAPWTALQIAGYLFLDCPVVFTEEGHIYTLDGSRLPSVTGILKAEGFIDDRFYDEYSRTRGTYVHKATHLDDTGELDEETLDPVIAPYVEGWRKFKRESGFCVEKSEVPMCSKTYRYAGTPDVIGHFPTGNIKRAAVELHDDGTYKLITYTDRQDANLWLSILAVHNWKNNHGRKQ
ncbi:MAG: hypothetical protein KKB59_18435, partial [Spirochaetes bacterium]|nr:hypothetical protein [Spirochaetota bacterium]